MTHDQQVALSHWSMYGEPAFPVRKLGRKWTIEVSQNGIWAPVGKDFPIFATKTAACEFFNNLVLMRAREWRAA